jgi:hypothetical protein
VIQRNALAAIGLLLGFSSAPAQQPLAPSTILRLDGSILTSTEVDATVAQLMKDANVTGVGIAGFSLSNFRLPGFHETFVHETLSVSRLAITIGLFQSANPPLHLSERTSFTVCVWRAGNLC